MFTRAGDRVGRPTKIEKAIVKFLADVLRGVGIKVSTDTAAGQQVLDMANGRAGVIQRIKDTILSEFHKASKGAAAGDVIPIGELTDEGRRYLESLSGTPMKNRVSFVINPSYLRHIYNNHYGENEKDSGKNVPLDDADISNLVDVITQPDKVVFAVEKGTGVKIYFFKENPNGTYNLTEVYSDKHGKLTARTYFKTKRGISQRVDDLKKSPTLTSVTEGASPLSGAKVPQHFELPKLSTGNFKSQRVFHGSGADFDRFDHSHMGEGEGNWAYGWGTYLTEVEGIGRVYAEEAANNPAGTNKVLHNGKEVRW